ncbi:MbtH family protein [Mixta tenebrionis]|uniref:MbtH family protein n=1 Tax=Mixta tenebrionis TaxID=2562439 RepID=A0A506VBP6_9GAMM|nr:MULTISPECIES: MbtH family protein [Mixta]QHM74832.1 Enterobactin biosynthesis protein YbdZ [Mixta theicola]TPW42859.1 MbtH family protein [Mixta tenebrionis]
MSQQHTNPFDDETSAFYVLINARRQYSLWPEFAAIPAGWQVEFGPEKRASCLAYVEREWQEMRPASLQRSTH